MKNWIKMAAKWYFTETARAYDIYYREDEDTKKEAEA